MYSLVELAGWTNIVFISIMISIYPIKLSYLVLAKKKGRKNVKKLGKLYNFSKRAHPFLGVLILSIGFYHGYNAFSLTVLHTGTILLYLILTMGLVALVGSNFDPFKKHWRIVHRSLSLLVVLFAILHVFWKNII